MARLYLRTRGGALDEHDTETHSGGCTKMIRESQIKHERGSFWVLDTGDTYTVMRTGVTHSVSDSAYPRTDAGLSIAVSRCDYLAKAEGR